MNSNLTVEVTREELDVLVEVMTAAEHDLIHSLDHADTRAYKVLLRQKLDTLERLKTKMDDHKISVVHYGRGE